MNPMQDQRGCLVGSRPFNDILIAARLHFHHVTALRQTQHRLLQVDYILALRGTGLHPAQHTSLQHASSFVFNVSIIRDSQML